MAKHYWTETERAELKRLAGLGYATPDIAKALNLSINAIHTQSQRLGVSIKPNVGQPITEERWALERQGLNDTIRELRTELSAVRRETIDAKSVRRQILGLPESPPDIPKWIIKPGKAGKAGTPFLQFSDTHWAEKISLEETSGINEYGLVIGQQRIRRIIEKTISICFEHTVNPKYDGIVVNVLGDMVSGDIHEDLSLTNEVPIMPAVLDLFGVLIWAFTTLADRFGRVFVPWVPGNHGRNTTRLLFKGRHYRNFDWLLGCLLERHFQADKRLQFYISPDGTDAYFTVAGFRFLSTHGDQLGVKGGDGIIGVLGPMARGTIKIANQVRKMGQDFDYLSIGHFHTAGRPPGISLITNGSVCGWGEWARLGIRATPEPPKQNLFFVHPDYGVTNLWEVFADKAKIGRKVDWVSWPK